MKHVVILFVLMCLSVSASAQSPSVYSIGTGNVTGEVAHYASLKAACDSLNVKSGAGITSDRIYYFTSSLTEPANVNIGLNTNGHTITFKPYTGTVDTITFTQTADNVGLSGGWIIGVRNLTTTSTYNYGLSQHDSTENIVIDGSNTAGGKTRDLSIVTAANTNGNTNPIRIYGKSHYITVKNVVVSASQSVSYGIVVYLRNSTSSSPDTVGNYVPDNITIDNCSVTNTVGVAGQGLAITASGTPTQFPTNVVFSNNYISARTRGIFLNYGGNTNIFGNNIYVNQTSAGYESFGIWAYIIGLSSDTINIYNNKVSLLSTVNTSTGAYGVEGIWAGAQGVYNIYNNTITGFTLPNLDQGLNIGIGLSTPTTAGITANVYYNSVYMADTNTAGATPPTQAAFYMDLTGTSGTRVANVENNIFATNVAAYTAYAAIVTTANAGTLTLNYNLLYSQGSNGKIGKFGATDCATFASWETASSQDANSVSGSPQFVSGTTLRIDSTAIPNSPAYRAGTVIPGVTTDQSGKTRDATHPCIGAFEFVPVVSGIATVSIAEAGKVDTTSLVPFHSLVHDTLMITGVVTTPNIQALSSNTSFCVQDTSAGIDVFSYGLNNSTNFAIGDSVFVIGTVQQYHGLIEFVPPVLDSLHFGLLKHNATVPKPQLLALHYFLQNAEKYMSQLVEIDSLSKSSGTWPGAATNASIYLKASGSTDSVQMFINKNTNVGGVTEPPYPINLVGAVSQYTSSVPPNNGYEIIPRSTSDIGILTIPAKPLLVTMKGAQYQRADTLILKWHPSAFPVKYLFQLSKSSSFSTFVVNDSTITDTTKKLVGLDHLTQFFWRVSAYDAGGYSSFSATDSFTTIIAAPSAPALASPHGTGIPRRATFAWHPSPLAVTYNLQVSSVSNFSPLLINMVLPAADTTVQISDTLDANVTYYWRVGAIDTGGTTFTNAVQFKTGTGVTAVEENNGIPKEFALFQNYPNPFNPSTMINFNLPKEVEVQISVYNVLGQRVALLVNETMNAGYHHVMFNGEKLPSGAYFYIMRAGDNVFKEKMLLLK